MKVEGGKANSLRYSISILSTLFFKQTGQHWSRPVREQRQVWKQSSGPQQKRRCCLTDSTVISILLFPLFIVGTMSWTSGKAFGTT